MGFAQLLNLSGARAPRQGSAGTHFPLREVPETATLRLASRRPDG